VSAPNERVDLEALKRLKVTHRIAGAQALVWNKLRKLVGRTQPRLQRTGFSLSVKAGGGS